MKKLISIVLACFLAVWSMLVFAPTASAAVSKPSYCSFTINNGLLNPTLAAICRNTTKQYRAVAWCQVAYSYGSWVTTPGVSKATCFLVFVDAPKSGVQFR